MGIDYKELAKRFEEEALKRIRDSRRSIMMMIDFESLFRDLGIEDFEFGKTTENYVDITFSVSNRFFSTKKEDKLLFARIIFSFFFYTDYHIREVVKVGDFSYDDTYANEDKNAEVYAIVGTPTRGLVIYVEKKTELVKPTRMIFVWDFMRTLAISFF